MSIWIPDLSAYRGPRYRALAQAIEAAIENGQLAPGSKLPPHRTLADALGVTVGTVARGYAEAERRQLLQAQVGSGTYVRRRSPARGGFRIPDQHDSPDLIDLSLSLAIPSPARETQLAQLLAEIATQPHALHGVLDYQPETGLVRQRAIACQWLAARGVQVQEQQVLLTNGGQHGITLALQALARAGDTVCADALSYPGFIAAARQLQLRVLPVAMDDYGPRPEAFEQLCRQQPPRLFYCMPALHNPTCSIMPLARRLAFAALAERYGVWLVEDDVQSGLMPTPEFPPLAMLAPKRTVHLHSLSKIFGGGFRVGMLSAPDALSERLRMLLRVHCWMTAPLLFEIAARWLDSALGRELLAWQQQEIQARQQLVAHYLAGYEFHAQAAGFNVWLHLPEAWRGGPFAARLEQRGVRVQPAEVFAIGRLAIPQAVRLCVSSALNQQQLERALHIIRTTLSEEPELEVF